MKTYVAEKNLYYNYLGWEELILQLPWLGRTCTTITKIGRWNQSIIARQLIQRKQIRVKLPRLCIEDALNVKVKIYSLAEYLMSSATIADL